MSTTDKNISEEKEIDLIELAQKLWDKRDFIVKVFCIGLIAGIIIAFSIPKEYSTSVVLAPEAKSSSAGNLGTLAAMAGVNLNQPTEDAISLELYPNIVGSTPFLVGLFNLKIVDRTGDIDTDLYTYLDEYQKNSWWSYIFAMPSKLLRLFSSKEDEGSGNSARGRKIYLSKDQSLILENLAERINVSVDKKTGVITLSSLMQNPEVSAYIADTVTSYLQSYIIEYRTQKARQDLYFTEKLYEEAQANYLEAQQKFTTYLDKNLNVVSARYGVTKDRLQNNVTLASGIYNQMAQQLQMARVKVQDMTPVYTIIEPPVVPIKATSPKKKLIVIGFVFLAFLGACSWIIVKDFLKNSFGSK